LATKFGSLESLKWRLPPRSLAAEANDCFMVRIRSIQPNTMLRRNASRPKAGSPRFVKDSRHCAAKTIGRNAAGDTARREERMNAVQRAIILTRKAPYKALGPASRRNPRTVAYRMTGPLRPSNHRV
jgi:hypothetical protein